MDLMNFLIESQKQLTDQLNGSESGVASDPQTNADMNPMAMKAKLIDAFISMRNTLNALKAHKKSVISEEVVTRLDSVRSVLNARNGLSGQSVVTHARDIDERVRRIHRKLNHYLKDADKQNLFKARDVHYYRRQRLQLKSKVQESMQRLNQLLEINGRIDELSKVLNPLRDKRNSLLGQKMLLMRNIEISMKRRNELKLRSKLVSKKRKLLAKP